MLNRKKEVQMNIYEKLQSMRVELQKKKIHKSGRNKFAGYDYFELSDILPHINQLQEKHKTCSFITFDREIAKLTILNSEKVDEKIEFTIPMATLSLKGANEVQNLGGCQTYSRRYLYLNAFEIVEHDYFDAIQGKETESETALKAKKQVLNNLVSKYASVSGKTLKEITEYLISRVGKNLKSINESEATELITHLNELIGKVSD